MMSSASHLAVHWRLRFRRPDKIVVVWETLALDNGLSSERVQTWSHLSEKNKSDPVAAVQILVYSSFSSLLVVFLHSRFCD
jgi:hypothetical protein